MAFTYFLYFEAKDQDETMRMVSFSVCRHTIRERR